MLLHLGSHGIVSGFLCPWTDQSFSQWFWDLFVGFGLVIEFSLYSGDAQSPLLAYFHLLMSPGGYSRLNQQFQGGLRTTSIFVLEKYQQYQAGFEPTTYGSVG